MITAIAVVTSKPDIDEQSAVDTYNVYLSRLEKLCEAIVAGRAGTVVRLPSALGLGDAFELHIPIDFAESLKELVDRAWDESGLKICIGLGHDIHEAKVAAEEVMDDEDGNEIRVYHPDMDEDYIHEESDSHLPETTPQSDNLAMYKAEETIIHTEKAPDQKSGPIVEAMKVLASIKQNAELYQQIQQTNPELYKGIIETLQALIQIVMDHKSEDMLDDNQAKEAEKAVDHHQKKMTTEEAKEAKEAVSGSGQKFGADNIKDALPDFKDMADKIKDLVPDLSDIHGKVKDAFSDHDKHLADKVSGAVQQESTKKSEFVLTKNSVQQIIDATKYLSANKHVLSQSRERVPDAYNAAIESIKALINILTDAGYKLDHLVNSQPVVTQDQGPKPAENPYHPESLKDPQGI